MFLLHEIRKRARHIAGPVLAISAFGYFAYHSVQGDRGLIAWVHLSQQVEIAQAALERTSRERLALERRANLLRPDNLDPDLLDERVRQVLSLVRPDEILILDRPSSAAPGLPGGKPAPMPVQEMPVRHEPVRPAPRPDNLALADLAAKLTVSFAPAR